MVDEIGYLKNAVVEFLKKKYIVLVVNFSKTLEKYDILKLVWEYQENFFPCLMFANQYFEKLFCFRFGDFFGATVICNLGGFLVHAIALRDQSSHAAKLR